MKKYYPKCGTLHEFVASAPNFCESCGNPFNASIAGSTTRTVIESPKVSKSTQSAQQKLFAKMGIYDAEDEDLPELPNLERIEAKIEFEQGTFQQRGGIQIGQNGVTTRGNLLGGARGQGECSSPEEYTRRMQDLFSNDRKTEITPDKPI